MHKFIIPLFALAFLLVSCNKNEMPPTPAGTTSSSSSSLKATPSMPTAETAGAPGAFDGTLLKGKHTVIFRTSKGDITVEMNAAVAPKTVTNFLSLAKSGYFDGLTFHRIIPGFMVQGGDPNGDGTGGSSIFGASFEDEINADSYGLNKKALKEDTEGELPPDIADKTMKEYYEMQGYTYNDSLQSLPMVRGALAMANRGPNTNGSQFFMIHGKSTPWLEGKHTVFGMVTKGMDIVDAITNVARDSKDKPLEPITYTVEVVN